MWDIAAATHEHQDDQEKSRPHTRGVRTWTAACNQRRQPGIVVIRSLDLRADTVNKQVSVHFEHLNSPTLSARWHFSSYSPRPLLYARRIAVK